MEKDFRMEIEKRTGKTARELVDELKRYKEENASLKAN